MLRATAPAIACVRNDSLHRSLRYLRIKPRSRHANRFGSSAAMYRCAKCCVKRCVSRCQLCFHDMKELIIPPDALLRFRAAATEFACGAKSRASRLEAVRDDIAALRAKGASFRTISKLLSRCGIGASDTCVMRFCHRILGESPVRAHKAKHRAAPHKHGTVAPNTAPTAIRPAASAASPMPGESAQVALLDDLLSYQQPEESKPITQGGPRIAKIQFANPNDV